MLKEVMHVDHVSLNFSATKALDDLSFDVQAGEIFGFLGPSGAGKTTTIKLLTGQLKQDTGTVSMFHEEVMLQLDTLYQRIGILSDNSGVYENLTVYENLKLFAQIRKQPEACIPEALHKIKLAGEEKKQVKKLSRGMKQRLLFACAILHNPEVLFLDEPTSALDPATSEAVHDIIRELNREGTTIFLTTHNMEEADKLCDRVAFLHQGHIVELGKPDDLKVKYAKKQIQMVDEAGTVHEIVKDRKALIKQLESMEEEIVTIHSIEPDLKTIFLDITGREL